MLPQIPLLVYMIEIATQLFPASVAFFEREIIPELFVEQLVNWRVCIDSGSRINIPVPDT
jgi:hypothetical protein